MFDIANGLRSILGTVAVFSVLCIKTWLRAICWADQAAWTLGALFLIRVCKACLKHVKEDILHRSLNLANDTEERLRALLPGARTFPNLINIA